MGRRPGVAKRTIRFRDYLTDSPRVAASMKAAQTTVRETAPSDPVPAAFRRGSLIFGTLCDPEGNGHGLDGMRTLPQKRGVAASMEKSVNPRATMETAILERCMYASNSDS